MPQLLPEGAPATLDNDSIAIPDRLDLAKSVTYKLSAIDSSIKHAKAGSSLTMTINDVDYSIHFVDDAEAHMPPPHIQEIPPQPQPVLYPNIGQSSGLIITSRTTHRPPENNGIDLDKVKTSTITLSADDSDFIVTPLPPLNASPTQSEDGTIFLRGYDMGTTIGITGGAGYLTSDSGGITLTAGNPTSTPSSITVQRNNLPDTPEESDNNDVTPQAAAGSLSAPIKNLDIRIVETSSGSYEITFDNTEYVPKPEMNASDLAGGAVIDIEHLLKLRDNIDSLPSPQPDPIPTFIPETPPIPYGARIKDTIATDTEVITTYEWINNHYIDVSGDDAESYNAEAIAEMFVNMAQNYDRAKHAMWIENTDTGEITITSADYKAQRITFEETGGDTGAMLEVTDDNADLIYGARDMQELETDVAIRSAIKVNDNRITLNAGLVTEGTKYVIHFDGNDTQYIAQKDDTINDIANGLNSAWWHERQSSSFEALQDQIYTEITHSTDPITQDAYIDFAHHFHAYNTTPSEMPFAAIDDPDFTVSTYQSDLHDHVVGMRDGSVLVGQKQINTLDYSDQDVRLHIDLDTVSRATGQWASSGQKSVDYDYISGFHNILSGSGHDYIEGSNADNHISGADGDDMIFGRSGNDLLMGGIGNDTLYGGLDDDTLYGGLGDDMMRGGAGDDIIYDYGGSNTIYGESGDDAIKSYGNNSRIFGGSDNDMIHIYSGTDNHVWGGDGDDMIFNHTHNTMLYGGKGNDHIETSGKNNKLFGYDGDDTLIGGYGNDFLYGQEGSDIFYGDWGQDYMFSGGADGAVDQFFFNANDLMYQRDKVDHSLDTRDRVVGFETGTDKIHLDGSFIHLITETPFYGYQIDEKALSIVQSIHGANIYDVTFASHVSHHQDFGLLVTTTGGALTGDDFIFHDRYISLSV